MKKYISDSIGPGEGLKSILPPIIMNCDDGDQKIVHYKGIFDKKNLDSSADKIGAGYYETKILDNIDVKHYTISMVKRIGQRFISKKIAINNHTEMYGITSYDGEGDQFFSDGRIYFDKSHINNDIVAVTIIGSKSKMVLCDIFEKSSQDFDLDEGDLILLKNRGRYTWRVEPNSGNRFRALIIFRFGYNDEFIEPVQKERF